MSESPALWRLRKEEHECEASLGYRASFSLAWTTLKTKPNEMGGVRGKEKADLWVIMEPDGVGSPLPIFHLPSEGSSPPSSYSPPARKK